MTHNGWPRWLVLNHLDLFWRGHFSGTGVMSQLSGVGPCSSKSL
jgi:hypothetical protein